MLWSGRSYVLPAGAQTPSGWRCGLWSHYQLDLKEKSSSMSVDSRLWTVSAGITSRKTFCISPETRLGFCLCKSVQPFSFASTFLDIHFIYCSIFQGSPWCWYTSQQVNKSRECVCYIFSCCGKFWPQKPRYVRRRLLSYPFTFDLQNTVLCFTIYPRGLKGQKKSFM